ncbi:MAG: Lon protease family protein [Planctomycetota bacterium]|jgi:ATP-dependent Lon protease
MTDNAEKHQDQAEDAPQTIESIDDIVIQEADPFAELAEKALRWTCDPGVLDFETTQEVEPLTGVIGQEGAIDALKFGLAVHAPGQNIFVRGLTGTGRMTLVHRLLQEIKLECPNAQDRCYVHNFAQPDRPRLISLDRGSAGIFRRRIDALVNFVRDDLDQALSDKTLQVRREALEQETQQKVDAIVKPFEEKLREVQLALVSVKVGPAFQAVIFPSIDGKPVMPEEWQTLRAEKKISDEQAAEFEKHLTDHQSGLREVMNKVNAVRREFTTRVDGLREEAIRSILAPWVSNIVSEFDTPAVRLFLEEFVDEVATAPPNQTKAPSLEDELRKFRVNVLLRHDTKADCPIVIENTPTVGNLLGSIDHKMDRGNFGRTDHMMIRSGSILRADGGYLIIEARDVVREPGAWKVLLRTLRTGFLEIVPPEFSSAWYGSAITPEPIKVNFKVILLGDAGMYYALDEFDPDFPNTFKVLADFGSDIEQCPENIREYARVISRIANEEDLIPFDCSAVAALAEHGARISGKQTKLTTRFGRLADLAREASFIARQDSVNPVTHKEVRAAVQRSRDRASLPSRRFQELLSSGTIRMATAGTAVGQVNGLAVTQAGPLTFGFPARITATIGPGTAGVINIEREANLSGAVHTKGFYILGGLMRTLLRTDHPLAFDASIAFEQSYGGIDGDSASGAEICCLISALTEIPLRQDLAMTGAIDQVGNILAIGAANEKVEGFFDTCRNAGLSGTQGAIIPQANAGDLMLRLDVVKACRDGEFHVYAVSDVFEALELLTGLKAGRRGEDGQYPVDTVLGMSVIKAYEYWLKAVQGADWLTQQQEEEPESGDDGKQEIAAE